MKSFKKTCSFYCLIISLIMKKNWKRLLQVKECYALEALAVNTTSFERFPFYAHMNEITSFIRDISTPQKYRERREQNVYMDFPRFVATCEEALRQVAVSCWLPVPSIGLSKIIFGKHPFLRSYFFVYCGATFASHPNRKGLTLPLSQATIQPLSEAGIAQLRSAVGRLIYTT